MLWPITTHNSIILAFTFKNLDNNSGVFHNLIDAAEEEECKETILAYYHLLMSGKEMTAAELDKSIENWFEMKFSCAIDFEVQDAINKLIRLGLVVENHSKYQAIALIDANRQLDHLWDNYFNFEV